MAQFSRALRGQYPVRIAAIGLGLAWLAVLGAFAYGVSTAKPGLSSIVAAAAALSIAGAGILYAWREPGR